MSARRCECRPGDHNPRTCTAGPSVAFALGLVGVAYDLALQLNLRDTSPQRAADAAEDVAILRWVRGRAA
jgi:hypothetical protein